MRIGIIAPEFPPEVGGMQRYAREVTWQLSVKGHKVTVFTRPHTSGEISLPGVTVLPLLKGSWYADRGTLRQRSAQVDIWHVMNAAWAWVALEVAPVVLSVYGNDILSPNPVAGFDFRRRFHLPKGSNLDFRLAQWRTPRVMRRALPRMAHIFAISRFTEALLLERFPQCKGLTSVAYLGVSPAFHEIRRVDRRVGQPARLLTVCRLSEPRKNVALVLRALARLKDRYAFEYTVVGDGALRPELESLAAELAISERVRFAGAIDDHALHVCYAHSDLFILTAAMSPKSVEGFGIVYLEAAAAGVPSLAARIGGAVDAVAEGASGMFVDDLTDEAVSVALAKFLSGEACFDSSACRAFAEKFSWERIVEEMLTRYPAISPAAQASGKTTA